MLFFLCVRVIAGRKNRMSRRRKKKMMLGKPYFTQMFKGLKTTDARPAYSSYGRIQPGFRLLACLFGFFTLDLILFVRLPVCLGDYIHFCEVGTGRMIEKEIIEVNKYQGFRYYTSHPGYLTDIISISDIFLMIVGWCIIFHFPQANASV